MEEIDQQGDGHWMGCSSYKYCYVRGMVEEDSKGECNITSAFLASFQALIAYDSYVINHSFISLQAIKGANRFKNKGLQNEDQLGIMFEDLRNTGDDHWSASTGVRPSEANLTREDAPFPVDDDEDDDAAGDDDDSEPKEVTPTSVRGKRARVTESIRGRKPKTATGQWFQQQMGKIVDMNERTTASCESIARREDTSGCSIQDVMALVKDCGATSGTNEHFIASIVFTKRAEREMFMTLDTAEERFQWLTKKYEWMTRND